VSTHQASLLGNTPTGFVEFSDCQVANRKVPDMNIAISNYSHLHTQEAGCSVRETIGRECAAAPAEFVTAIPTRKRARNVRVSYLREGRSRRMKL